MKETLTTITYAVFCAIAFFSAIYIQQELTKPLERKADMRWCQIQFGDSKATIPCERISRLD